MNDLNGLDWSSKPATGPNQKPGNYSNLSPSALKPTPPRSGRASPFASNVSLSAPSKTSIPTNDSFSNLVSFSGNNANKNLSLQEQQKRLADLKLQELAKNKKNTQDQWAGGDDVWNNLGSGRNTPAVQNSNDTPVSSSKRADDEDDLFATFDKPVHATSKPSVTQNVAKQLDPEDDDPFGLSELQARNNAPTRPAQSLLADDDDILGDLGRPVTEQPPPKREPSPKPMPVSDHPQDKAVAELVEMGFPADKARRALESTETGLDVQAAVGLLLNQAHEVSRQKARGRDSAQGIDRHDDQPGPRRPRPMQSDLGREQLETNRRERSSTPSGDAAKAATDLGTAFMKSAGAFWKQAQKQVQHAVSELNSDSDSSSQPKWMREAAALPQSRSRNDGQIEIRRAKAGPAVKQKQTEVTDEVMMLESERPTPPPRSTTRSRAEHVFDSSADTSRDHSPVMPSRLRQSHSPQPAFMRQQQQDPLASMMRPKPQAPPPTRSMLNRQAAEDQASQAYVSSARRRKPAAAPSAGIPTEGDLLEGAPAPSITTQSFPSRPARSAPPQSKPKPVTPVAVRPPAPTRNTPSISPIALKASHTARISGNDHFKRGDYAAAHASYTTSLSHLPQSHPITIILLTNRALTALKTGDPKQAIADADATITLIGPSKGDAEMVDLGDGESTPKPMRDYYGKALMRKAEALENLEKWSDASVIWRQAVEDGHGGATAIQGRARAERAAQPKPVPKPVAKPVAARKPMARPATVASSAPAAAVSALRASNAAAEKLDDEKFALADSVSAKITNWKGGKEGNLRALLASLDAVLWNGSGWKKVSMADLVLPNKVKIIYMKGIAKCHPDKVRPSNPFWLVTC